MPKLDLQLKENAYTVPVKKVTAKVREAEKVKKLNIFQNRVFFYVFFRQIKVKRQVNAIYRVSDYYGGYL
jgi:hypothetical protein